VNDNECYHRNDGGEKKLPQYIPVDEFDGEHCWLASVCLFF
jgi:hypothetical protein